MTQIMNLLMLDPEIQEELLFLPRVEAGREEVCLRDLQAVAGVVVWKEQRALQVALQARSVRPPMLRFLTLDAGSSDSDC